MISAAATRRALALSGPSPDFAAVVVASRYSPHVRTTRIDTMFLATVPVRTAVEARDASRSAPSLPTVPQPDDDWAAGYMRPYGEYYASEEVRNAARTMGVTIAATPFPGSRLFLPAGGARGPAVLMLHGSEGGASGYSEMEAAYWASRGFPTLAYSYFGVPGRPHGLGNVSIDDALEAARWLKSRPESGGGPIGLLGVSRGAEMALLAASHAPRGLFGAVLAHSPQEVAVGSFAVHKDGTMDHVRDGSGTPVPAWSVGGRPVETGTPIPVERITAPVFLSVGTEDDVWSPSGTRRVEQRLAATGRPPVAVYAEGEGHVINWPQSHWLQNRREQFLTEHLTQPDGDQIPDKPAVLLDLDLDQPRAGGAPVPDSGADFAPLPAP